MKKTAWTGRIKNQMQEVGTYKPAFDAAIITLAGILEQRDAAFDDYVASGGNPCFEHVGDRGARNIKKNPRLQVWMDLNTQALAYWRDMGLTPAGLKKLNEAAMKEQKKGSALEEALRGFGDGA